MQYQKQLLYLLVLGILLNNYKKSKLVSFFIICLGTLKALTRRVD